MKELLRFRIFSRLFAGADALPFHLHRHGLSARGCFDNTIHRGACIRDLALAYGRSLPADHGPGDGVPQVLQVLDRAIRLRRLRHCFFLS